MEKLSKTKKLSKILKKTSNYFLGIGNNKHYDNAIDFINAFYSKNITKEHVKSIKRHKRNKIITKNVLTIGELLISGMSIINNSNYSFTFGGLALGEATRYLCNKLDNIDKELILKEKKHILQKYQKHGPQTLDKIAEAYELKEKRKLENWSEWPDWNNRDYHEDIKGEEWKQR